MRQDNAQARERFTSSPATRLDSRLPLVKDAEDTVEVRRFDQAVPAVRVQCAAPPARVAVRVLIRLMMAHLNPKALQHVVEPEIELRLDALAERIAQGELRHLRHTAAQPLNLCHRARGVSPFQHGIVSSTRALPIRTNITRQGKPLKAVRHNMRPNPPPLDRPTTKEHTEPARRYNRPGKRVTWPSHDADKPGNAPTERRTSVTI